MLRFATFFYYFTILYNFYYTFVARTIIYANMKETLKLSIFASPLTGKRILPPNIFGLFAAAG